MNIYQQFSQFIKDFYKHYPRNTPLCTSTGCHELQWKEGFCKDCIQFSMQCRILTELSAIRLALEGTPLEGLQEKLAAQLEQGIKLELNSSGGTNVSSPTTRKSDINIVDQVSGGFIPGSFGDGAEGSVKSDSSRKKTSKKSAAGKAAALSKHLEG